MRVRHLMTLNPVACDIDSSCREVAQLMANRAVGSAVVLDSGHVVGLVTDRLLARECLAGKRPPRSSVRHVMIREPACLSPDDTIFAACDTMRSAHFAQRIPVIGPGRELLGIVGIEDIAAVAKDLINAILDKELHSAKRARALTGAKRIGKAIRRPTKASRLPPELIVPKRRPSRPGLVAHPMPSRRTLQGVRPTRNTSRRPVAGKRPSRQVRRAVVPWHP